jgi:multiple sugar transport system ATP-binding protein
VLQQCDTPQVLYDRPTNIFVAGFIGSPAMNLLECTLSSDATVLTIGSQTVAISDTILTSRPGLKRYAGQRLVTGIRPEDLSVAGADTSKATINCDVELVEALGSELLVHFRTDAKIVNADAKENVGGESESGPDGGSDDADCVARVDPHQLVRAGERTSLEFASERLEFFEPASGLAVWE